MKRVDFIHPGSINSITGPVANLKRVLIYRNYFKERGYDVSVFSDESYNLGPLAEVPVPATKISNKVSFRRYFSSKIRMAARTFSFFSKIIINRSFKNTEKLVDYYLTLDRHPDVVEFESWITCFYYLKKRSDNNAKTVMFYHTDGIPFEMELQYYPTLRGSNYIKKQKDMFDWTVAHVDRIVFIARIGQMNFLNLYKNRSKDDTAVILNGIDDFKVEERRLIKEIREKDSDSRFKYKLCCTGTINYRKGQNIIIEALHKLPLELLSQVHVDFIGDGGERPVLEQLVSKYGLQDYVTFYGMIPNIEVYKYLAQNNIYILMSRNEGLPISIIEGMRASLPVISTKIAGIPELVDESNGYLINPDSHELAEFLKKLPEYNWTQMGENSRKRFEKEFTFERMRKEFCDMYDKLL